MAKASHLGQEVIEPGLDATLGTLVNGVGGAGDEDAMLATGPAEKFTVGIYRNTFISWRGRLGVRGVRVADLSGGFEAIHDRHVEIHEHEIHFPRRGLSLVWVSG